MNAPEILTEAARIVGGDRNSTHGEKERSFKVIGNLWNAYLQGRKAPLAPVSPRDVAQMMALLKIGRSVQGTPVADHFLDQAGYSAIAGELAALEATSAPVHMPAPGSILPVGQGELDRLRAAAALGRAQATNAPYVAKDTAALVAMTKGEIDAALSWRDHR